MLSDDLSFKVLEGRIFISIDLHVCDMPLFGRGCLVNLDKSLTQRRSLSMFAKHDNPNDRCRQESYSCKSHGNVDTSIPFVRMIRFPSNGISLCSKREREREREN